MLDSSLLVQAAHARLGCILDSRFELVGVLRVGAYGIVYSAVDVQTSVPYAVKALLRDVATGSPLADTGNDMLVRETVLLSRAQIHPNVIPVRAVIDRADGLYLVMKFCPEGDLFVNITEQQRYVGRDALIRSVFLQLVDAVSTCHSLGIFHRDLKPENVLVADDARTVYLCDFGLATTDTVSFEHGCGSSFYMSPECCASPAGYNTAANDVWSLGVLLINLSCGRNPWRSAQFSDDLFQAYVRTPDYLRRMLPISAELNHILDRVFDLDPSTRMTLPELYAAVARCTTFTYTSYSALPPTPYSTCPPTPVSPTTPTNRSPHSSNNPFRNRMREKEPGLGISIFTASDQLQTICNLPSRHSPSPGSTSPSSGSSSPITYSDPIGLAPSVDIIEYDWRQHPVDYEAAFADVATSPDSRRSSFASATATKTALFAKMIPRARKRASPRTKRGENASR